MLLGVCLFAVYEYFAARRFEQAGQRVEERGLAAAGGPTTQTNSPRLILKFTFLRTSSPEVFAEVSHLHLVFAHAALLTRASALRARLFPGARA